MYGSAELTKLSTTLLVALAMFSAFERSPARAQSIDANLRQIAEVGLRWGARGADDVVPAERREALGLEDTTWTKRYGKIHPDVYKALDKAEEFQARAGKPREAYLDPVGLGGTVYVQVQLRYTPKGKPASAEDKAAIKQLQHKVLSQLTAAEVHVQYAFRRSAGFLAYVNRAGLEKLKSNDDVAAVVLDDKPFAEHPPHVLKADLPPLRPGDPSTQPAHGRFWGSGGNVESEVYQALGLYDRVFVIVNLTSQGSDGALAAKQKERNRQIENGVLGALTADDFWLQSRITSIPSIQGLVSKEGLKKLESHPQVQGVGIENAMFRIQEGKRRR